MKNRSTCVESTAPPWDATLFINQPSNHEEMFYVHGNEIQFLCAWLAQVLGGSANWLRWCHLDYFCLLSFRQS